MPPLSAGTIEVEVFTSPFTVIIDTREQNPFTFDAVRLDKAQQRNGQTSDTVQVLTTRATLQTGDYSIQGLEDKIAIERKSAADLCQTITHGRDRFVRELERMQLMDFGMVVVETELSQLLTTPPDRSKIQPKTITRSVIAWQQRYKRIHWMFLPGRRAASNWTYRVLERYWKDQEQEAKEGEKGS